MHPIFRPVFLLLYLLFWREKSKVEMDSFPCLWESWTHHCPVLGLELKMQLSSRMCWMTELLGSKGTSDTMACSVLPFKVWSFPCKIYPPNEHGYGNGWVSCSVYLSVPSNKFRKWMLPAQGEELGIFAQGVENPAIRSNTIKPPTRFN